MLPPGFPSGSTLVMAHPDDEVLWASSILRRLEQIVLCFEEVASRPEWGEGRRRSLAAFPLPGVIGLRLQGSEVFNGAAWPEPVETEYGLAVRRHAKTMRGFSESLYRESFSLLVTALRPLLVGVSSVVTHSPWGEYGHEEHVQVFRAVAQLQREMGFALWVPAYVSGKSYGLMLRHLSQFDCSAPPFPTDPGLGTQLQALYTENSCWTWFDDYVWPARETFWRWTLPGETPAPLRPGSVLNMLWIDWSPPRYSSRPRRLLRAIRQKIRR